MRVVLLARQGAVVARTRAIGQPKALIVKAPQGLRKQPALRQHRPAA
jgi:hypothetical protein